MRFSILGPLLVHDASGRPVTIGGTRLRTLLMLLLLRPGQRVPTEQLTDAIWAEGPPSSAGNALQALVSRLRRALGPETKIQGDASGYRLAIDPQQVDLAEFDTLAKRGRSQLAAGEYAAAVTTFGDALALWRGPALPELTSRGVAEDTALRLAETHGALVEDHLTALLELGRADDALPEAEALARREPHRERPVELLMRALAGTGRTADALDVHDGFRDRLAEELGLDPSPRLADVHLRVLRGEFSVEGPPSRKGRKDGGDHSTSGVRRAATPAPQLRLPTSLTSFVPREAEVDTAVAQLTGSRLVTLIGPGGAGKTRLAIEAVMALADRAPELLPYGGWFVELAPIGSGDDIVDALAAALDLREHAIVQARSSAPAGPAEDRVAAFLADRPALVVLDNCEHLVAEVARVVEPLLARCPGLRLLTTSREPLGVQGERLIPVPPLSLPPEGATAERAAGYASVELFTERARAVRPDFAVTPDNVGHVVCIVRDLDGMPLALELAAVRLRSMTPAQLVRRLSDRFRLLTGGGRSTRPGHRTLRAVVDWSWELLDEPERRLLRRLSIFAGGATLEAVEKICADPGEEGTVGGRDAWDVLFTLVDKSLVIAENPVREDAPPRYRQLETVRAYAAERLTDSGEEDLIRDAHACYVRDLWREGDPLLRGPRQTEWVVRLNAESDNCGAAVRWAVRCGDVDLALDLVEYTQWYWILEGGWHQFGRWCSEVLSLVGGRVPEGRAIAYASCLFHTHPEGGLTPETVLDNFRAVREVLREAGERPEDHPALLYGLVYEALTEGPDGPARERVERAADQRAPWTRAMVLLMLALLDAVFGDAKRAMERALHAREGFRDVGDSWGELQALIQLSDLHRFDDLDRCRVLLADGIRLADRSGLVSIAMLLRIKRAEVLIGLGDTEGARRDLESTAEHGPPREDDHMVIARLVEARLLRESGDLERAREAVDDLGPLVTRLGGFAPVYVEPQWLLVSASVAWRAGDTDRAWRDAGRAWWRAVRGLDPICADVLEVLGPFATARAPEWAATLLGYARALRGMSDVASPLVRRAREELTEGLGGAELARLVAVAGEERTVDIRARVSEWLAPIVPDDVEDLGWTL
ncbi:BTAD domain-containing putative transcriptional regulator [Nocardiopsis lucentensis]|uniref:BTAD domain-containing putative transcriptional regulator n=1 Tax=Nocardiopsis lucentensis TaxID=53441 RepID=UPI0003821517|nr:BTAD domain-containing putative transcriptional regulator [Nocardiopsis lucentensis]